MKIFKTPTDSVERFLIFLILVACAIAIYCIPANAQISLTSVDRSYFYVIAGSDTISQHSDKHKAIESLLNYPGDAEIRRTEIIRKAGSITETIFLYEEPAILRNVNHTIIEDSTDPNFRLLISGYSGADRVKFASKCIGYDSTGTAIDDRRSLTLYPDSTGFLSGETTNYTCYRKGEGMNALLTYWLTAYKGTEETTIARFIDIAHVLNLN